MKIYIFILNGEQPEAVEDSEVALKDTGWIVRAHPEMKSGLTKLTRFVLASTHSRWPHQKGTYRLLDEVN